MRHRRHEHHKLADHATLSMHLEHRVLLRLFELMSGLDVRPEDGRRRMLRSSGMKRNCAVFWSWRNGMRKMVGTVMSWAMRRDL